MIHSKKIENVLKLSIEDRYNYFINKVTDFEEVWGLFNSEKGWALISDNNNRMIIPFWPEQEFAMLCCSEQWQHYHPKLITLDDLKNKWLPGMKRDNKLVNIFYTPDTHIGSIIDPEALLADLITEP